MIAGPLECTVGHIDTLTPMLTEARTRIGSLHDVWFYKKMKRLGIG